MNLFEPTYENVLRQLIELKESGIGRTGKPLSKRRLKELDERIKKYEQLIKLSQFKK